MRHPERPAMQPAALRRGPRFGPGLLLAIVAGALVWNLASRAPQKPAVEHTTHPVEAGAALSAPEPAWLVSHAAMLKLSASQLSALQGMAARWGHNTKALRMELGTASARFETSAQVHAHGDRKAHV